MLLRSPQIFFSKSERALFLSSIICGFGMSIIEYDFLFTLLCVCMYHGGGGLATQTP